MILKASPNVIFTPLRSSLVASSKASPFILFPQNVLGLVGDFDAFSFQIGDHFLNVQFLELFKSHSDVNLWRDRIHDRQSVSQ